MVEAGDLAADRTETSIGGGGGGGLFHAKTDIDTLRLLSLSPPRILVTGIYRPTHSSVAGELMPGPLLLSAFQ